MGGGRRGGGRNRVQLEISGDFSQLTKDVNSLTAQFREVSNAVKGIQLDPRFAAELENARNQLNAFRGQLGEVNPFDDIIEDLDRTNAELRKLERAFEGLRPPPEAVAEMERLRSEAADLRRELGGRKLLDVKSSNQELNETASVIRGMRAEIRNLVREFGTVEVAPEKVRQRVAQLNTQIALLGGQTESAMRKSQQSTTQFAGSLIETAKRINDLTRQIGVLNRSGVGATEEGAAEIARLSKEADQLRASFTQLSGTGGVIGSFFSRIGGVVGHASQFLGRFGLNVRDVGLILGSGLLSGGVALIVRELLRFVGVAGRAIAQLAALGGAFTKLENQIADTFGSSAQQITDFSRSMSQSLGLSEVAILTFVGRLGQLFQAQGASARVSAEMSEGLLVVADVLRRTTIGAGSYEDALRAVQNTLAGNIEGLREYNIFITEVDLRQQAAARSIDIASGALDAQTRQFLTTLEAIDQAQDRLQKLDKAQSSFTSTLEQGSSLFKDLKATIGQAFAPVVQALVTVFNNVVTGILSFVRSIKDALKESENYTKLLKTMATIFTTVFGVAVKLVAATIAGLGQNISFAIKVLDKLAKVVNVALGPLIKTFETAQRVAEALNLMDNAAERAAKEKKELAEAEREAEAAARSAAETFKNSEEGLKQQIDEVEKVIDARKRLADAIEDGAERIAKAEETQRRAVEDSARAIEDAERKYRKSLRDRRKAIEDASRKVIEVEKDNARAILDAQDKLSDAQTDQFRAIRDAEEKLRDVRIDAAKRVKDADKAVQEAREKRLDTILDATLALEKAQRAGNLAEENEARIALTRAQRKDQVKDAELALKEAVLDATQKIKDAERDLFETRIDHAEKVAEAEENLRRVYEDAAEKKAEAERNLSETIVEESEKVAEAARDREKVYTEAERRIIDAVNARKDAEEDAAEAIAEAKDAVIDLDREFNTAGQTLDELVAKAKELKRVLDAIRGPFKGGGGGSSGDGGASGEFMAGGMAPGGKAAWVGEVGPELIIPNSNSTVVSNAQVLEVLREMMGGRGGTSSQTIIVNEVANDPEATAFAVSARLARSVNN